MGTTFILSKAEFVEFFDSSKEDYDLFGPVVKPGGGIYSDTDICVYEKLNSFGELALDKRAYFSAKEIAFPVSEKLFDIDGGSFSTPRIAFRKKIIFARSCDIEGFGRLDKIFLESGPAADFYYKRLRDSISFFMIECGEGFDDCFCQSVGADHAQDYALSIRENGDRLRITIRDEGFGEWFTNRGLRKDEEGTWHKEKRLRQRKVSIPNFENRELFESPLWQEYAKRCIACGRCNVVCPTCHCFSIYDAAEEKGGYIRRRTWSACQIDGFAKVAGGHEYRVDKGTRMRYKLFHKFYNFEERFEEYMCVGCGRCIEACPEYIDIRASLEKLSHG